MPLPRRQHSHHRLIDPGTLPVPERPKDLPLNHKLPESPLCSIIRGFNAGHGEKGEPVIQAIPHLGSKPPHLLRLIRPPRPPLHHGPRLQRQPRPLPRGRLIHGPATETPVQAPQRLPEGTRLLHPLRKVLRLPEEMGPAPLYPRGEAWVRTPAIADDDPIEALSQYLLQNLAAPALPDRYQRLPPRRERPRPV